MEAVGELQRRLPFGIDRINMSNLDLLKRLNCEGLELDKSVCLMNSPDFKGRFRAECVQVAIRALKLKEMLDSLLAGTLNFKPKCPETLLRQQLYSMLDYLAILKQRAEIEDIDINFAEVKK